MSKKWIIVGVTLVVVLGLAIAGVAYAAGSGGEQGYRGGASASMAPGQGQERLLDGTCGSCGDELQEQDQVRLQDRAQDCSGAECDGTCESGAGGYGYGSEAAGQGSDGHGTMLHERDRDCDEAGDGICDGTCDEQTTGDRTQQRLRGANGGR